MVTILVDRWFVCCLFKLTESSESPMKLQCLEGETATMTTTFNSLHYHIISRCSTYNSRPPLAGALMFGFVFWLLYQML